MVMLPLLQLAPRRLLPRSRQALPVLVALLETCAWHPSKHQLVSATALSFNRVLAVVRLEQVLVMLMRAMLVQVCS
jgi:hypothetical protein